MTKWVALTALCITFLVELIVIKLLSAVIGDFELNMKWVIGIGVAMFGFLFLIISGVISEGQERRQLKESYANSLANLAQNPSDYQLRANALQCGRQYYASLRENKQLTVFDEQAIQNDLYAAGGK